MALLCSLDAGKVRGAPSASVLVSSPQEYRDVMARRETALREGLEVLRQRGVQLLLCSERVGASLYVGFHTSRFVVSGSGPCSPCFYDLEARFTLAFPRRQIALMSRPRQRPVLLQPWDQVSGNVRCSKACDTCL